MVYTQKLWIIINRGRNPESETSSWITYDKFKLYPDDDSGQIVVLKSTPPQKITITGQWNQTGRIK